MMNTQNMIVNGYPMHILTPEEIEEYLERIGAKNNSEKKEEFSRFDRDD